MKRIAITAILLLPVLLSAYPGIGGGRGLFRVQNALVESDAGLTISLHALGRNPQPNDTTDKVWVGDVVAPELNYAPLSTRWVGAEVFGAWGAVVQYPKDITVTDKEFGWGLHDLRAGAKLSIPFIPVLKLGAMGTYEFIERDNNENRGWQDPNAIPALTNGFGWRGLATLQFQDLSPSLPNLLFNYGQAENTTFYGAAVELAANEFALFAEVRSLQPEGSAGIFDTDSGEVRLTPGVAFGTGTSGATFKAGYTFSWGSEAPNEAVLGLVIATPFGRRTPPQFGTIAGKVVDNRTSNGLLANVTFPENPRLQALATSEAGIFTIEQVPVGVVVVAVEAEGYHSQAIPVEVTADAVSQYEFTLRPLVTYGVIAGIVTDANTNQPLAATIEFPGTDVVAVENDPATGAFRIDDVPVGVYTVTATNEEYFKGTLTVQVEEGRVASPTFALKPLTMRSTITGKVSNKKTGEPIAATVSFPGSGLADIANDPETGVYKGEIPVGSYAIKVTSEGYLPQTAAIVIEENKPLIRDFELVQEGMSITLRGIYFDFNKATIKSESHGALQDAARIMQDNPTIRVEIQGHTDSKGSDEYNQSLSERRAQSVVTYIVQNFAISASRLVGRGYGESKPIASNATEEGRALNRRVEFFILGQQE
jgi:outer membrane protein OmpA-like peptidoglycan-associated protein